MAKEFGCENSRVQLPAILHLLKLGYTYIPRIGLNQANSFFDPRTNIITSIFKKQFLKLNPQADKNKADQVLRDIINELSNDDLGKNFYQRLVSGSAEKLIDFDNPSNNSFHCTAEFSCYDVKDDATSENKYTELFRPDITLFINGLPLVYIEVKIPNNREGIVAERKREYDYRLPNKRARRFNNITQLMIFSNNMEYDNMGGITPVQGAFYCTGSTKAPPFNCFREDNPLHHEIEPFIETYPYKSYSEETEKLLLEEFNVQVYKSSVEYQTNKKINTPTNKILTSMCEPNRLLYIIKYGIAYVCSEIELEDGSTTYELQKHIMRYQQLFAALALTKKLDEGIKKGIIWHTQGSGKTALSYYLVNILTDYYAKLNIVPKFYFIVDRIDLKEQASREFKIRGLDVHTAETRAELMEDFQRHNSLSGNSGKKEITVINIQRFDEKKKEKIDLPNYNTNLQRIFIIDEAHRSYDPKGSFLANLLDSDRNAVRIALTGTPLIGEDLKTTDIFGNYIHTYYYDKSILDGYTLKIIREDIETSYKNKLQEIYEELEKIEIPKNQNTNDLIDIKSHPRYVKELLRYIIRDLKKNRNLHLDADGIKIGGMIICDSSDQAKALYEHFMEVQSEILSEDDDKNVLKAALILHDSDDKEIQQKYIESFRNGTDIDVLIVFNMLLTGFDAPRLKRLYVGRKLKDHGLLQAITRVNRTYKKHKYGYIVDFADIKENFATTNANYLKELNKFNNPQNTPDEKVPDTLTAIFEEPEKIITMIEESQEKLFDYSTDNVENFITQINCIEDKQALYEIRSSLTTIRNLANVVRAFGKERIANEDVLTFVQNIDMSRVPQLMTEVNRRIDLINFKEIQNPTAETLEMIADVLDGIEFKFSKVGTEELVISANCETIKDKIKQTAHKLSDYFDQEDPEFITLKDLFMKALSKTEFKEYSQAKFDEDKKNFDEILERLEKLKKQTENLFEKYKGDAKFVRVHKRIHEENKHRTAAAPKASEQNWILEDKDITIYKTLMSLKNTIDLQVYNQEAILKSDPFFEKTVMSLVGTGMNELNIVSPRADREFIKNKIVAQYLNQYHNTYGN
ncbi:HsdR family type I site-specific deoxyribonuclease [Treponema sp.]|uniref:HsdR family type I site-specific deoxyribonuclease n=1 Tax=Treponema sp. TaxID=166 RepID=UPI00298E061B|nr:HsdR family type I site-specific deoxyribonuclease [Treponema sp.]MCQ2240436.1 HsdR family type I site-specific deoxyribonuclease [Treponema sp.]